MDALAWDGRAEPFTPDLFADVVRRLAEHEIAGGDFTAPRLLARFERYTPVGWYALARRAPPGR